MPNVNGRNRPPKASIRFGTVGDLARCRTIELATQNQFVDAGHTEFAGQGVIPDGPALRAIDDERLLVAEFSGQVVGWAFLTRSEGELCIGQLAVDPSHQRQGMGTALMEWIITNAERRGEMSIVLSTQADVEWNQPWYERFGFVVVPRERWTDDMKTIAREQGESGLDWKTRVHMRKQIGVVG